MTRMQRLILSCFPRRARRSVIRESKSWQIRCLTCQHHTSVWEMGGIRWKAVSSGKRILFRCPVCRRNRWAAVEWQPNPINT